MRKIESFILVLAMIFLLSGCTVSLDEETQNQIAELSEKVSELEEAFAEKAEAEEKEKIAEETVVEDISVNVMVLNGTTGFGMAKLISDAQSGETALDYQVSVETDASNVTAALISGSCDIAALPTNAAATVYNKTEGGIQIAAINTLGVLYLVENQDVYAIQSLEDLDGLTVYVPAQNPTFLFQALVNEAGIDVTIDNTYAQPADLRTALAAGEVNLAVLPEPMVTIACSANESLNVALDLTKEWDSVQPEGSLVQGCVVVRTQFAEEHPEIMKIFMEEYGQSVAFLQSNPEDAAQMIETTGIFTKAAVALKAIPNCNVCFITGEDMKTAMNTFLEILFDLNPQAVGGAIPGDDFYYLG